MEAKPQSDAKPADPKTVATPAVGADAAGKPGEPIPANALSKEEQMKRFAKELKQNDWGHQPC